MRESNSFKKELAYLVVKQLGVYFLANFYLAFLLLTDRQHQAEGLLVVSSKQITLSDVVVKKKTEENNRSFLLRSFIKMKDAL